MTGEVVSIRRRARPRLVEPERHTGPYRDYRDSAAYQRTQKLQVPRHTKKQPGDLVLTGSGVEVHP